MKSNWLKENISEIIALSFVWALLLIFRMVLLKQIQASETLSSTIIQSLTNIVMLIVGYYFGSSSGSKAKQQVMDSMNTSQTNTTTEISKPPIVEKTQTTTDEKITPATN